MTTATMTSKQTTQAGVPIIQTKLSPPRITGRPQRRDRLLASLDARLDKRLTLILGPAGCGKSTFSALWRRNLVTSGHATCWYNLSYEDADLSQFVTYLASSFGTIEEGFGSNALAIYNESAGRSLLGFVAALTNALANVQSQVYLFLEDFHSVQNPEVCALVDLLLELAPPTLHLVITSRSKPPLSLVKLRAKDDLNELSFADLRFTLSETCAFLQAHSLELSAAQMSHLHVISDGWAAGLQLMAYSLKKSKDPASYISRLQGTLSAEKEESLTRYIEDAISLTLSQEELDFLVCTSACKRFNSELCQLITGNDNAQRLLDQFEADSLFLIPIDYDDERQWYRFHRTFGKFLNEKLLRKSHDELKRINRIASQWFADRGLQVEAIRHTIYAGEVDACVSLVEQSARDMVSQGQFLQLLKWFHQLPKERTRGHRKLLLSVAWAQVACSRSDELEWTLSAIQEIPNVTSDEVGFELQMLNALQLMREDDTAGALVLLEPYLLKPPTKAGRFLLYSLNMLASLALVYADEFDRVRDLAHYNRAHVFRGSTGIATPFLDGGVGLSYLLEGDVRQARDLLSESLKQTRNHYHLHSSPEAYLAGYLAEAHYQLDELELAEELLAESASLIDLVGTPDSILFAHRIEVRLLRVQGKWDKAFSVLKDVEEFAGRRHLDRLLAWSLMEQVDQQLTRNRVPAAKEALRRLEHLASSYESAKKCARAEIPLFAKNASVILSVALGEYQRALDTIVALTAEYDARGRMYGVAEMLIRCANVQQALGLHDVAFSSLCRALSIASQNSLLRLFIDLAQGVSDLLEKAAHAKELSVEERAFAVRVHAAMQQRRSDADVPRVKSAGEQKGEVKGSLSAKELEIIELLSKAFSNKSIGRTLNISAGTVKWHLKNIFTKLDAVSREDAVVKARNRKLIS